MLLSSFGITPQWYVSVNVVDESLMGGAEAHTNWTSHYRDTNIYTHPKYVKDRRAWVRTFIHECMHLVMADLHDHLIESTPKNNQSGMVDLVESTISESANIMYEIFMDAYDTELDKLL